MPSITIQPDSAAGVDSYIDEQATSSNYNDVYLKTGQYDYSYNCNPYSCNCYSCGCSTCCNWCSYPCFFNGQWTTCNSPNCSACGSYSCNCSTCCSTCYQTCWSYNGIYRSFFKFDLSSIPAGATVSSATVTLTRQGQGSGTTVALHRVTSSWTEASPTWASAPTYDVSELVSSTVAAGETTFSVTTAVQNWVNSTWSNYGFALKAATESDYYIWFHSSDSATASARPKLAVTYNTVPNAPTPTAPAAGASIKKKDANTFSWTFSDPDSGDAQTAWALKRTTGGTDYWWRSSDSTWQASETYNTSSSSTYNFAAHTWPAGSHTWSIATKDPAGAAGAYSLARSVTVSAGFLGWGHSV